MQQLKTLVQRVLALVLWVITLVLGLLDVYFAREIFFAIYARFSAEVAPAATIGMVIILIGAMVYLGFVVMSSEYHLKNVGKHESWDLFTRTLVVQLAIPFLAFFMR